MAEDPVTTERGRTVPRRAIAAVAIVAVVVAGAAVAGVRSRSRSESASSADASVVVDEATTTTTQLVPKAPDISTYVSPDQPTAVGVRTATFVDPTRGTSARGERPALADRPLQVTIRYPTVGMPSGDELVDAPTYVPAPLLLFAHGYDISSSRYDNLLHDLASFGFVVVAPEFPMSSTVFDGSPDEYDIPEQARDLSFLISALTGPDAPPEYTQMISPGPVGLIGHSDGAVTVLLAAYAPRYADSRVGAVVAISGDYDTFGGNWFTTNDPPLIAVHGEWDEINPFYSSEELVANDPGPAMLVGVMGSTHLAAANGPENEPSVARLSAFDFRWRLQGSETARAATYAQAMTPPLEIVTDHD